ncbi:zinc metallopeptidase [Paenactinomyces guangxiensis]|uniref:Zinc metallopeptidase n=1 Tax=Paenactinomyces guangxiensis TaxID=1490290 RepID=A0A7W1WNN0_9BACL|nr:zinc metallopeptidase [Paenactinomyces guangxiensis]MBA4493207.1 zinc metallopeptidase [Paenactinomyces guangxiensis]MBH8589943.1 zinc metallopeptidase [Paenactinomyces guangxiensis]
MFGLLLFILGLILTLWAQFRVRSNFRRWSRVRSRSGMTGAEVARRILDMNGLHHVPVEPVHGTLSDHYDPTAPAVRLSEPVYSSSSISAVSVAAHECGHALQHKEKYGALVFRHRMVPVLNFTSGVAPWLLLAGVFMRASGLLLVGIAFFSIAVLFHLVTLPVEFNASSRAKRIMIQEGFVAPDEEKGVNRVLGAAAFTYVAGALVALLELLRFVLIFLGQRDDD